MTSPTVTLEPLHAEAFAPFGEVLSLPAEGGRLYYEQSLANRRPGAWPSLSLSHRPSPQSLPLLATQMERHEFSSQSFIPMAVSRWLVVVAPHGADGQPDVTGVRAFVAGPDQGVTYGANVWHHPLVTLDGPASFAVWMWREDNTADEEFVTLSQPFQLVL